MAAKKLSDDDRILWGKVARTTRALPGRMEEIDAFEIDFLAAAEEDIQSTADKTKVGTAVMPETPKSPKTASGQHQPLERPVKRKLAKGRLQLEARIDLHGLFQGEAHALLHGFILRAHERGLRHVLVITGKGSSMGSEGALKRAVPMWFSKPEFRHLISSYETSAQTHGGEGALYVRLSRPGGERP
jgi:DNA-nicking Smr family endonuclease